MQKQPEIFRRDLYKHRHTCAALSHEPDIEMAFTVEVSPSIVHFYT